MKKTEFCYIQIKDTLHFVEKISESKNFVKVLINNDIVSIPIQYKIN
jgi:hypothetical protein